MTETAPQTPRINALPFWLADALLVGLAFLLAWKSDDPFGKWQVATYLICLCTGAWISIKPALIEYHALLKLAEADRLANAVDQINNIHEASRQVASASAQLQSALDQSSQTVKAAGDIGERMTAEVQNFTQFMAQANEKEKSHLKLEAEKLRRNEAEWLQVVVRMLDHTYALHQAAMRSSQPGVAEQIGRFQSTCADAARRVGVASYTVKPGEAFNPEAHQLVDPKSPAPEGATVLETLAPGMTFQGQLIRPALVKLNGTAKAPAAVESPAAS